MFPYKDFVYNYVIGCFKLHLQNKLLIQAILMHIQGGFKQNDLQSLLNFSGYKLARRLGHISFEMWDPKVRLEYKNFYVRYSGAEK